MLLLLNLPLRTVESQSKRVAVKDGNEAVEGDVGTTVTPMSVGERHTRIVMQNLCPHEQPDGNPRPNAHTR